MKELVPDIHRLLHVTECYDEDYDDVMIIIMMMVMIVVVVVMR